MQVTFYTDASAFLSAADGLLASDPLRFSVLASVAARHAKAEPVIGRPCWFATISDGDRVVCTAMRTHPGPPHAGFAPAMPSAAVEMPASGLASTPTRPTRFRTRSTSASAFAGCRTRAKSSS